MDALSDPLIHEIWLQKSAQTGGSEFINNVIGFFIHHDPSPILLIQPTLEMGEAWSKERFAPMLRDTPALRNRVKDARSRDSNNTLLNKSFPGGHIAICGANSPVGLASRPIRIFLCDEIDKYPKSAGTEGDPIKLGSKRTTTFWNRKKIFVSTPTVKGESRIEAGMATSDKRYFWVPCPHCKGYQVLKWANIQWPENLPADAYYRCEHCAAVIVNTDKAAMLLAGEWRASRESKGIAGFYINEPMSPWVTFGQMAAGFIDAKDLPDTLKAWVNTSLGETWEEKGEQPEWIELQSREEDYQEMLCPADALLITAGIDIQDDRAIVVLVGWGEGEESWRLGFHTIYGDTSAYPADVWDELAELLALPMQSVHGIPLRIECAAIDSGHRMQCVYNFVRDHGKSVIAVKGQSVAGKALIGQPSLQDVSWQGKKILNGVQLWPIGVDTAKEQIYSRLKITAGPGHYHFPRGMDEAYYKQLTAEKRLTRYKRGRPYYVWQSTGENHALDCEVYAYAAAMRAGMARMNWDARRQSVLGAKAGAKPAASPGRRIISRGI